MREKERRDNVAMLDGVRLVKMRSKMMASGFASGIVSITNVNVACDEASAFSCGIIQYDFFVRLMKSGKSIFAKYRNSRCFQ